MAATKHALAEESDPLLDVDSPPSKKLKVAKDGDKAERKKEKKLRKLEKEQRREEKRREKKAKKEERKKEREAERAQRGADGAEANGVDEVVVDGEIPGEEKPKKEKKEKKGKRNHDDSNEAESSEPHVAKSNGVNGTNGHTAMSGTFMRERPYRQSRALRTLPKDDIDAYMKTHSITVADPSPDADPDRRRPIMQFSDLPETDIVKTNPFKNFKAPTPIQAATWPYTLAGRDIIGVAETGSGKTMAFALPCVEAVSSIKKKCVKAVIVSPTRELAMQTHAQMESLAELVGLDCVCLYGGASKTTQRAILDKGVDIIVATPGRMKDFMSDETVVLKDVRFVVLDEADRMLDKGFEQDIKDILGAAPPREQRQTMMFTATWPASVQALASSFMIEPVKVTIGSGGKETVNGAVELQANARIAQKVEVVEHHAKEQRLLQILKQYQQGQNRNDRILVFCLYKKEAVRVEAFLRQRGVRVVSIHGDLAQDKRTKSLEAFKSGKTPVLVATDVAARGLDIPEVKLVVNVTFPLTIEDYVHRIGRTGRAGKVGEAITLFTEQDKAHSGSLINILKSANQPVPDSLLKFGTTVKKKAHDTYGAFFKDVDMTKTAKKITFDD